MPKNEWSSRSSVSTSCLELIGCRAVAALTQKFTMGIVEGKYVE